jgi:hypothetical protein
LTVTQEERTSSRNNHNDNDGRGANSVVGGDGQGVDGNKVLLRAKELLDDAHYNRIRVIVDPYTSRMMSSLLRVDRHTHSHDNGSRSEDGFCE